MHIYIYIYIYIIVRGPPGPRLDLLLRLLRQRPAAAGPLLLLPRGYYTMLLYAMM